MDREQVEQAAKAIFEHYKFGVGTPGEKPAWVEGGNSIMQGIARDFARASIAAYRPLVIEECAVVADNEAEWASKRSIDNPLVSAVGSARSIATALRSMKEPSDG